MARRTTDGGSPDEVVGRLHRRAGGLLGSIIAEQGFAAAVRIYVRSARRIVETDPEVGGGVPIKGIRDEGAVWLAGEDAERAWAECSRPDLSVNREAAFGILARIFCAVAYRHPFFDGNKRTGLLAAVLLGGDLGLRLRPVVFDSLESTVIECTAREAPNDEVAMWLARNVFMTVEPEEERSQ